MKESINGKVLISAGMVLTLIVLLSFFLWLKLTVNSDISFESARQTYLSNYPPFLRNARVLTLLHMVLNMLAITCFFRARQSLPKAAPLLKFLIILNIVMLVWQVFSLM